MNKIFLLYAIIILSVSCKKAKNNEADSIFIETTEDTILERNTPENLDFSQHQVYIDTTGSSRFFKEITDWDKSRWDIESITSGIKYYSKDFKPKPINIKKFPSKFISLRKLNNQFVLYSRCNGIDERYEINKNAFIFLGPLESEVELISKVLINTKDVLKLELRTYEQKSPDKKSIILIEKINNLIYKLTYSNLKFNYIDYLTSVDKVNEFDLIVNYCPKEMMLEYDKFDQIEK